MDKPSYLLIDESVLPEIYRKVVLANELLENGQAASTAEAARQAGISRSVYYKYKNAVFPYVRRDTGGIFTVQAVLHDKPGVLVDLLTVFYRANANILTINQNIPAKGKAYVTVSARSDRMRGDADTLLRELLDVPGVLHVENILG